MKRTTTQVMTVSVAPSSGYGSSKVPVMEGDRVSDVINRAKSIMGLPDSDPGGKPHVWDATRSRGMTQLDVNGLAIDAFEADELVYLDTRLIAAGH